ncbi:MAG: 2-amino-4-hydroxy-6-hydroxymethyldihydropteridine diphosphokinase [Sphingorhabdus sp.]
MPPNIVEQAISALETDEIDVFAVSPTIHCAPIGPSRRCFANATAILSTSLAPPALLARLQAIEAHFGRIKRGQRWQARPLDLDIILWSGGIWVSDHPSLAIPHPQMRARNFVLGPASRIAADWRDPLTGKTIVQLFHRLNRAKPLDRSKAAH